MFHNLKRTTIKSLKLSKFVFLVLAVSAFSNCASVETKHTSTTSADTKAPRPLTERELLYEKGNALLLAQEYSKAEDLFLSLTGTRMAKPDAPYDLSLWNLSVINEKQGHPEKAILILRQLLDSQHLSTFAVKAALMKNYFRVDNKAEALKYKKLLDAENPKMTVAAPALYSDLIETLDLNYDHLLLQELDYVGEIQKYLIYVMEQNDSNKNERATDTLIAVYDRAASVLNRDTATPEFKKKVAISLLNNLHRFDLLKLNDLNLNFKTIAKFSNYSEKKQKQITDWLYK